MYYRKPFGATIRAYRRKAGFIQRKLAEGADLHHSCIGEVERGNVGGEVGCGFSNRQFDCGARAAAAGIWAKGDVN
jgi:hypothetical protein